MLFERWDQSRSTCILEFDRICRPMLQLCALLYAQRPLPASVSERVPFTKAASY